jgi:hypothetical protein
MTPNNALFVVVVVDVAIIVGIDIRTNNNTVHWNNTLRVIILSRRNVSRVIVAITIR